MNYRLLIKRKENKLYQTELAKRLNIHKQTYHLKETGQLEFTVSEAIKLAEVFECTLDELFGEKEDSHV